jgi:riboflavin synthase
MFTGLVEKVGKIIVRNIAAEDGELVIMPNSPFENLVYGESIAVNGVCLTLEKEFSDGSVKFHVLRETLRRSNLGEIDLSKSVNLERALRVGDRFGGHIVSGHIDTTVKVKSITPVGNDIRYGFELTEEIKPYVVLKGSISIDGISLTVAELSDTEFAVHLIPVTLEDTALKERDLGDMINIEVDMLGKYVAHQLHLMGNNSNISMDTLFEAGW